MDLIKSPYDFKDKKVLILGLGILGGGIGMARYCARYGAILRITDLRSVEHLQPALSALSDIEAEYILGEHRQQDIEWADLVIRNPGVPPDHRLLNYARALGKPIDMEMAYFIRHCPAKLLAVTGTKGKTSTTSILYSFLKSSNPEVGLAGNMGESAMDLLDDLRASDEVLLEVSSYQLEGLLDQPGRVSIALITNVGDDHLDRYGTIEHYRQVKASIGKGQTSADWLILPGWDETLIDLCASYPAKKVLVYRADHDVDSTPAGESSASVAILDDGVSWTGADGKSQQIADLSELRLLGSHNRVNVAFAAAAAHIAGRSETQISGAIGSLAPVAHRLQPAGTTGSLEFINDSAASAPLAVVAALEAMSGRRPVVITGGDDKSADFSDMITALEKARAPLILLPGTVEQRLTSAIAARRYHYPVSKAADMSDAVQRAYRIAQSDPTIEVVLLSPGFSSHSVFINEFDRGRQFCAAAEQICQA